MFSYEVWIINQAHKAISWAKAGPFQDMVCKLLVSMNNAEAMDPGLKYAWSVEKFNELLVMTKILPPDSPENTPLRKSKKLLPNATPLSGHMN